MSKGNGREHLMKRLVIAAVLVAATTALAPSVASARTAPRHVAPAVSRPMPARPAAWKAMWLSAQRPSPVAIFAPMPALERVAAMRLSPAKLAILKISSHAR
jgi:hypothetical protein